MHDLRALIALPLAIGVGFVGYAVAQTWNATLTAFALCGLVLVLGIAAHGVGSAAGVALHDRRTQAGPPTIHVGAPGPGNVQGMDPVSLARMHDLYSRVQHREHQRYLADFGMDAGRVQDAETGQFRVADWSEPVPAAGMGWDD